MPTSRPPKTPTFLAAITLVAILSGTVTRADGPAAGIPPNPLRPPAADDGAGLVALPAPMLAAEAGTPHRIAPLEIQCRAVERSALARLLESERRGVDESTAILHRKRDTEVRIAALQRGVLALAAEEARNRDAGTALVAYWTLAEAEHSLVILAGAIDVAGQASADHETLARRGLELPTSPEKLLARRLTLEDAQVAAGTARRSLVAAITELADLPWSDISTDQPAADIAAADDSLDVEALVAEGMASRAELRMLRLVGRNLDADTLGVARRVLAQVSPLLGGATSKTRQCFVRLTERREAENDLPAVCRQLRDWTRDREEAVAAEIRVAAIECSGNKARVAIARRQLTLEERMAADLRRRQTVGESDVLAIHVADLDVAMARRTVVEREVAWELSRVKLLQARGLLALQCGQGVACAPRGGAH